jgi:hypothetical protein
MCDRFLCDFWEMSWMLLYVMKVYLYRGELQVWEMKDLQFLVHTDTFPSMLATSKKLDWESDLYRFVNVVIIIDMFIC